MPSQGGAQKTGSRCPGSVACGEEERKTGRRCPGSVACGEGRRGRSQGPESGSCIGVDSYGGLLREQALRGEGGRPKPWSGSRGTIFCFVQASAPAGTQQ